MNIAELAERVATEQSLDKAQTRKVIEAALKAVVDAAKGGAEVTLPGFGKFKVQDRPGARGAQPGHRRGHDPGRQPQAGVLPRQGRQGRAERLRAGQPAAIPAA